MPTRPIHRRFSRLGLAVAAFGLLVAVVAPGLAPFLPSVAAATSTPVSACVLPDAGSMGQIDWDTFRRPVGTVRAVMLFVDFPDVPAAGSAETLFEDAFSPEASDWLAQSSYGKLNLAIAPLRHWLRMPEPLSSFKPVNGALSGDDAKRYIGEAIALADPEVDFSATQVVMIVPNREAAAYSRSSEGVYRPDEGWIADGHVLRAVVTLGSSVYTRGFKVLSHETSHAFGLRDYYNAFGSPTDKYVGTWSVMGDPVLGGDQFAYDKWRMGWLADSQVRCVTAASRADFVLTPLETKGGLKAVVLRTGLKTAVVAEFRTRQGLDSGQCSTGILIYKVNSALGGGAGPIRVSDAQPHSGAAKCGALGDAAFGRGGRWTDSTSGLAIDVTYVGSAARIRVTRSKAYVPPMRYARSFSTSVIPNADGTVTLSSLLAASGGGTACTVGRLVSLQEWKAGEWWTIRAANTDSAGAWTYAWTPTSGASYRLVAEQRVTAAYECDVAYGRTLAPGIA